MANERDSLETKAHLMELQAKLNKLQKALAKKEAESDYALLIHKIREIVDIALPIQSTLIVISKGDDPGRPGYSAFEGRTPDGQPLLADLRSRRIESVYVAGLTTEYCVKQTVLDALQAGLHVVVLTDAIAGIDAHPGDADRALREMSTAGAELSSGVATLREAHL